MIVIGQLRHRVTFRQAVSTPDGAGGFVQEWQDIPEGAEVAAAVVPLSQNERLRFQQLQSPVTHKIYVRYREDITADMRVAWRDDVYEIVSVSDRDGKRSLLEITAARGA